MTSESASEFYARIHVQRRILMRKILKKLGFVNISDEVVDMHIEIAIEFFKREEEGE